MTLGERLPATTGLTNLTDNAFLRQDKDLDGLLTKTNMHDASPTASEVFMTSAASVEDGIVSPRDADNVYLVQ